MGLILNAGIEGWNASHITFRSTAENVGKTVTVTYEVELQSGKTVTETATEKIVHYTNAPMPFYGFVGTSLNSKYGENPVYNPTGTLADGSSYMPIPIDYYEGEPVECTIPTCANPFVVIANGVTYSYPAGTTQLVPPVVAEVIEQHNVLHPVDNNPFGSRVNVEECCLTFTKGMSFAYNSNSSDVAPWNLTFDEDKGLFHLEGDTSLVSSGIVTGYEGEGVPTSEGIYIIPNPKFSLYGAYVSHNGHTGTTGYHHFGDSVFKVSYSGSNNRLYGTLYTIKIAP